VAAHFGNSQLFALPLHRQLEVTLGRVGAHTQARRREVFARCHEVLDFLKNPGVSDRRSANHHAVNAIAVAHQNGLFGAVHVTVAKNGNIHARIVFDRTDQGPVGLTLVHLAAGAAVNTNGLYANILQPLSHLDYVFGTVVPAEASFDGHRLVYGVYDRFGEADHFWNILEHAGSGPLAHHFLDRAAVVDVNQVGVGLGTNLGGLNHALEFRAKNLNANRPFVLKNIKLGTGFRSVAN
jgi:hypothetical protein